MTDQNFIDKTPCTMELVGSTDSSPSNAFSIDDFPAPVSPKTTITVSESVANLRVNARSVRHLNQTWKKKHFLEIIKFSF